MKKALSIVVAALILSWSAFATGEVTTGTTASAPLTAEQKAMITCISNAALTREWYLQSAYRTYTDMVMVAYLQRSREIKTAYESGKSLKEIRPMIKAAFDSWKASAQKHREAYIKERKEVWVDFKKAAKACRPDRSTTQWLNQDNASQERLEANAL